jgi:hypothetical protein
MGTSLPTGLRIAIAIFSVCGCTKLDSPNDTFARRATASRPGAGGRDAAAESNVGVHPRDAAGGSENEPPPDARTDGQATGGRAGSDGGPVASGGATGGAGGGGTGGAETGGRLGSGGSRDAGPLDAGCTDPSGLHGLGCYRCSPSDIVTLENACSSSACTPFVNASRLTKLTPGGDLPVLPAASGGAPGNGGAPSSGGTTSNGGSGGGSGTGVACEDLRSRGQILYVTGSSAAKPFLQQIAQQIAVQNIFIVYTSTGSCVGVDAVINGTPMTTGPSPAPATSATYWDSSSSSGTACDLPAAGVTADLGISDVFAASCAGFELVSLDGLRIRDAHGPVQTMTFVVPTNSRFSEISAQAAYMVFGFGADGGVLEPSGTGPIWNDEAYLEKRSATSGTQSMLAAAIGVPSTLWKGKTNKTSDDVSAQIQAAAAASDTADKAIGILAADYIDTKNLRAQIRVLAFQDTAQHCAVFPDSTASAHDKRNVRDGHYPVWGPLHLLYKTDSLGNPLNPANRAIMNDIIGYLSGTKVLPNGIRLIDVYAQSGLVPECAMRVARTKDGGDITPFRPDTPCSCLFEVKATGATNCNTCRVQGDCASGETCSQGYCER